MGFHPIAGLFGPGGGPVLLSDSEGCAHEDIGRWRSTRCGDDDPTHLAFQPEVDGEFPLCGTHARLWRQQAEAGLVVAPLDRLEVTL